MGDTPGQPPDQLHFLRLQELLLKVIANLLFVLALGDVDRGADIADNLACIVTLWRAARREPEIRSVGAAETMLHIADVAFGMASRFCCLNHPAPVFRMNMIDEKCERHRVFVCAVAGHGPEFIRTGEPTCFHIPAPDARAGSGQGLFQLLTLFFELDFCKHPFGDVGRDAKHPVDLTVGGELMGAANRYPANLTVSAAKAALQFEQGALFDCFAQQPPDSRVIFREEVTREHLVVIPVVR